MSLNYSNGISLYGEVIDPFDGNITNFTLKCTYCDTIYDTILSINDTIKSKSSDTLNQIEETLDASQSFSNAQQSINSATSKFESSINKILDITNSTQNRYNNYMDTAKSYDSERETYVSILFGLMFIFFIIPIIGILLKSKWCFKINWCLAMFCCLLLLIMSIPFIFVTTLSADFCVRLDEFEQALSTINSNLGKTIFNHSELNNNYDDFDNSYYDPKDTLNVVDTCFNGGSLLEVFNLSNILNWNTYKQQLYDALDIDISKYFKIDQLETFQIEVDTLTTDEYSNDVDQYIQSVNSIKGCFCIISGIKFDRNNLNPATQCSPYGYIPSIDANNYWFNTSWQERFECFNKFKNASYAVQIENTSLPTAKIKINSLKKDSRKVFIVYDIVYNKANKIILKLENITCLLDPLFIDFDKILNSFTNCGFLGERYGDFKKLGCITIFNDIYFISRAIVILAFMTVIIVFLSLCLDYVYNPWSPNIHNQQNIIINDGDVELKQIGDHTPMTPITPITPQQKQDGFNRIASASPRHDGHDNNDNIDGDFNLITAHHDDGDNYNHNHNDNDDNVVINDEMDGEITGNQPGHDDDDEYPVLPNDDENHINNNNNNIGDDDDEYPVLPNQQNDGEIYTVPQNNNNNINNYAD